MGDKILFYEVLGTPLSWLSPISSGKRFYDKRALHKKQVTWQLKSQVNHPPLSGPLLVDLLFYMPIPKSSSKVKKRQMLNGMILPIGKPDRTNLAKLMEDCLEHAGILSNDSIIVDGRAKKIYGDIPKTVIRIVPVSLLNQVEIYEDIERKC